jgi:hypothetical protein
MSGGGGPGPKEWAWRFLLLGLSSLLVLAAAEGGLRLFLAPRFTTIYRIDERYLHALIPGRSKIFRHLEVNGGRSILVRINASGFRGEPLLPAGSATRVVVYGDSIVEAEYSALEETFPERLESALAARLRRRVEAVNAGVVGYGPDQVSLRMDDEIDRLRPDLVLVVIFADNDFGDLLRNKLFRPGGSGALRRERPLISLALREEFARADQPLMLGRLLTRSLWWSDERRIDPLAGIDASIREAERMRIWLDGCLADYEEYLAAGDVVTNLMMDFYDADMSLTPSSRSASLKRDLMRGVLARMAATAAAHAVPLALVIVPSARDACPAYDYGRADRAAWPAWSPSAMTDDLRRMAGSAAIPAVSLLEPFVQRGGCGLYFRGGEDHWNDAGQALAGDLVAEWLISSDTLR